jgi:alpha-mannosidase
MMLADVEVHHLEKRKELQFSGINVVAEGPLRATVSTEIKYGQSTIRVNVCLLCR